MVDKPPGRLINILVSHTAPDEHSVTLFGSSEPEDEIWRWSGNDLMAPWQRMELLAHVIDRIDSWRARDDAKGE